MVAGGDVNLDVTWVLEGPVGPRRGPVGSGSLQGSISVLPALPVTLSADLCWAARLLVALQARHKGYPLATLAQDCLSPPRPAVCAALQGQAPSPETGFQELPRGQLPAHPGTSGDDGAVPWEPGWQVQRSASSQPLWWSSDAWHCCGKVALPPASCVTWGGLSGSPSAAFLRTQRKAIAPPACPLPSSESLSRANEVIKARVCTASLCER